MSPARASRGPRGPRRERRPRGRSHVGERFEVEVGPIAHGGHCVVRLQPDPGQERGRVVFVRHALPGERVTIRVTEGTDGDPFWRADAVVVHEPSPDRVTPPCPHAGPDACGGCDLQHVALGRQRALKGEVVTEQLRRLAGLTRTVEVEAVPGDRDGLGWRTRQRYVELGTGPGDARPRLGMRKHRSHELVEIDECLIAGPPPSYVVEAGGRTHTFDASHGGFWQVHPGAPTALTEAVLAALRPRAGEAVLDLYGGVGLFARFLADDVGPDAPVTVVEGDVDAAACAERNLPGARVLTGDVASVLAEVLAEDPVGPVDLVVMDPPREGAKRRVVEPVVALAPRSVAYVACDPAALARDVAIFAEHGWALRGLRAFDLFPMTHHVECVALLEPGEGTR